MHEDSIPTFESLEQEFENQEGKTRQATSKQVEYRLLIDPKHGKEITKPYYDLAALIENRCDTLIAFVNHLKNTLNKDAVSSKSPQVAVRLLMMRDGMAKTLRDRLNQTLDSFTGGMLAEAHLKDSIRVQFPATFGNSQGWETTHFSGTFAMAQMELSRIKKHLAEAEWLVVSKILDYASRGCALSYEQHWGLAIAKNSYLYTGDRFEAMVLFALQPDTFDYKVVGVELGQQKLAIVNGIATYTAIATGTGLHKVDGKVVVRNHVGDIRDYDVHCEYLVAQPLVVVRVDSGQIIYAGVPTPITVKVTDADEKDVVVTAIGGTLQGNKGKYVLTANAPGKLTVKVARKNTSGRIQTLDSTIFRVKELK